VVALFRLAGLALKLRRTSRLRIELVPTLRVGSSPPAVATRMERDAVSASSVTERRWAVCLTSACSGRARGTRVLWGWGVELR
jgi:hypothetical protein